VFVELSQCRVTRDLDTSCTLQCGSVSAQANSDFFSITKRLLFIKGIVLYAQNKIASPYA
jgi:hypothetical protein